MNLNIIFTRKALCGLRAVTPENTRAALRNKISEVADDHPIQRPWFRKLTNRPAWRIRQGNFRALVEIDRDELIVLDIDDCKDVYR